MSSTFNRLAKGSEEHDARMLGMGQLEITPAGNSKEALKRFQSVASEAIKQQSEGYDLIQQGQTGSGNMYDRLVLKEKD